MSEKLDTTDMPLVDVLKSLHFTLKDGRRPGCKLIERRGMSFHGRCHEVWEWLREKGLIK